MKNISILFSILLSILLFSLINSLSFDAPVITIEKDESIPKEVSFNEDSEEVENNKDSIINRTSFVNVVKEEDKSTTSIPTKTTFHPKEKASVEIRPKSANHLRSHTYIQQGIFTFVLILILKRIL